MTINEVHDGESAGKTTDLSDPVTPLRDAQLELPLSVCRPQHMKRLTMLKMKLCQMFQWASA